MLPAIMLQRRACSQKVTGWAEHGPTQFGRPGQERPGTDRPNCRYSYGRGVPAVPDDMMSPVVASTTRFQWSIATGAVSRALGVNSMLP